MFTTVRNRGKRYPRLIMVDSIRFSFSFTALSGRLTIKNLVPLGKTFTSMVMDMAATPCTALPKVLTIMDGGDWWKTKIRENRKIANFETLLLILTSG